MSVPQVIPENTKVLLPPLPKRTSLAAVLAIVPPGRAVDDERRTDVPVVVQVLQETGFKRLQCRAAARHGANKVGDAVALIVRAPDRILIGACHLPGHLVAGCRLHRADRRPGAKLTIGDVGTKIFERGAGPAAPSR